MTTQITQAGVVEKYGAKSMPVIPAVLVWCLSSRLNTGLSFHRKKNPKHFTVRYAYMYLHTCLMPHIRNNEQHLNNADNTCGFTTECTP